MKSHMKIRLWAVAALALTLALAAGVRADGKTEPEIPPYSPTGKPDPTTRHRTAQIAGTDKIVFVKRQTYTSNHYYTEFINSAWNPGGNICVLDLKTGKAWDLVPELKGGVFGRFDLNWEADKIVFAWKAEMANGYRLYEIDIDPATGERAGVLRQLTSPPANEAKLQALYKVSQYHHGTDDMHPCYLPDGDIVFISTRCQFGVLCNAPDEYTTTVLYRRERDTGALTMLSNSALSEASPAVLDDGRIMYTRWEYVDKGSIAVKGLWAMRPDGSASAEIYGNTIGSPPTMIYGRPIPEQTNQYIFLGAPHYPQNAMGTVIRLDMNKPIRSRDAMTLLTPDVTVQRQEGWHYRTSSEDESWKFDKRGFGRLFKDPYPLSMVTYLVSHKPAGSEWRTPNAYQLYLLNETGEVRPLYVDKTISCFLPHPLRARKRPPVVPTSSDPKLAAKGQAVCVVTDVYHGMEGVERGAVKYIRVLEQVPRPWAAQRRWGGDHHDQQHACISDATHLGLKVQHGVVPVEADGSAHFLVPANRNVFLQTLDKNYMAVQTERTFVNYKPGETRSCIGCHETPAAATARVTRAVAALERTPSVPGPQPGESTGQRPGYYDSEQLYDLSRDPGEQQNLAGDPEHQAVLRDMQHTLRQILHSLPGRFHR